MSSGDNPLLRQDYPDPDVIRVDDTYYMISTTMHFLPGGVILRSYDLLHWEIASYVFDHLDDTPAQQLSGEENIYGKGMWAASLRYHKGTFYVCFVCNDTQKTYLYQSKAIEGPWKKQEIEGFYHDCSLLFDDDDRGYIVYGNTQIYLTELNEELTAPKAGGLHRMIVDDGKHPSLGYEGSHFYKINGRYYLFLIHSLREEWFRTEACYSSDSLEGEFVGGDVLCDDMNYLHSGVAQGGIVDTPEGDWYAILFQDRGAVGRIPVLMPVTWDSNTKKPLFGRDGKVPKLMETKSSRPDYSYEPLYTSDDFDYQPEEDGTIHLKKPWQWNHTPQDTLWSVTERRKALRLHSGKVCKELTQSYNTLTQRTMEPESEAIVMLDGTGMNCGDRMGLAAFQGCYGAIALQKESDTFSVIMLEKPSDDVELDELEKAGEPCKVVEQRNLANGLLRVKCKTTFRNGEDTAEFFFEQEGEWKKIGTTHKLYFKLDHFTGCRYGLFYYSTESTGGYADFMNFIYQ